MNLLSKYEVLELKDATDCMKKYIFHILWLLLLGACNVTKKVPDGSYLLNKSEIESDVKGISSSSLKSYLRQKSNSSMFILGKVKLHMHNIPNDNSTVVNRWLLKYGEPPVLYNDQLTVISAEQIRLHLNNKGYLNAEVDTIVTKKDKKANVTYDVTGNEPHRIRSFTDSINAIDTTIYNLLNRTRQLEVMKEGDIFDLSVLEEGRTRMTTMLRNRGYYNFLKDNFFYIADTTAGVNQVDVTLSLNNPTDSTRHQQHYIGNVTVVNGVNPEQLDDSIRREALELDTVDFRGMKIISSRDRFLRPQAIYYNAFLRPGRLYGDRLLERTYASLNGMGPVNQTSINLTPVMRNDTAFIDSRITLFPGNLHFMRFGVDGTNSAGDLGVAGNVSYEHRNFLKGGETFRVQFNAAYEFITSDSLNLLDNSFYEYGAETALSIPQLMLPWLMKQLRDQPSASTEFSAGINFQKRPEYLRQFFNLSTRFQWASSERQLQHMLEPVGVTYVRMPWKSDRFQELYMNEDVNPILRFSYDDQLIVRSAYNITYSNFSRTGRRRMPTVPFRIRSGIEVAGWLPRIITQTGGGSMNDEGFLTLFNQPYSEYVKGDIDFAASYSFDETKTIAAHIAVGTAYPYGNSEVLPFEKRYFGGGANSVRGWSTRTLGPGTYSNDTITGSDFGAKIGDVKLEMSVEYRRKVSRLFELAGFVDAGNIWTIRNYVEQPGGAFQFDTFYKELALAYGLGIRVDLGFLLLRLDGGMKAHNPGLPEGERWTIFKPNFNRDFAFHFAIGYPF